MSERHIAVVEVSDALIVQALGFPAGTILRRIYQDQRQWEPRSYFLTIEHPDLPIVQEGAIPQPATPRFHRGLDNLPVMDDWGIGS